MNGYEYYWRKKEAYCGDRKQTAALNLSRHRLNPDLDDPDYLLLSRRTAYFKKCLDSIPPTGLQILDVGGRLQPYRPLLKSRARRYVAIDPQISSVLQTPLNKPIHDLACLPGRARPPRRAKSWAIRFNRTLSKGRKEVGV